MNLHSQLPRTGAPHFHEASPLRSPRDADATGRQWQRNQQTARGLSGLTQQVAYLQQQLNRLRKRGGGGDAASSGAVWLP